MSCDRRDDLRGRSAPNTYRAGGARPAAWIIGTLSMAYACYVTIAIGLDGQLPLAASFAIAIGPSIAVFIRLGRVGASFTRIGVHVRNVRRVIFVPWEEVDGFAVGTSRIAPRIGILERCDGGRIAMWGLQGPNPGLFPSSGKLERVIERMNDDLGRRRGAAPHPAAD